MRLFSKARFGRNMAALAAAAALSLSAFGPRDAKAETAEEIDAGVAATLEELVDVAPGADALLDDAVAVLVIPEVTKATFIIGGAYGEGALLVDGLIESYWSYAAGSIGYQIGAQQTRQVMLFMTDEALSEFLEREGVEIGADLEVTVLDAGAELAVDTTQDSQPVVVIVFDRSGLLGGASIQGGKYNEIVR